MVSHQIVDLTGDSDGETSSTPSPSAALRPKSSPKTGVRKARAKMGGGERVRNAKTGKVVSLVEMFKKMEDPRKNPLHTSSTWSDDESLTVSPTGVVFRKVGKEMFPCSGIHKTLRENLWPFYHPPRPPPGKQRSMTTQDGIDCEKQIEEFFASGKKPGRVHARVVCAWAVAHEMELVTSQPAIGIGFVGTRADFLFRSPDQKLHLVELKVGFSYGQRKATCDIRHFPGFKSNRKEHALFQLMWMYEALKARGINTEPKLVIVSPSLVKRFTPRTSVQSMAGEIIRKKIKVAQPLPARHRKQGGKLLRVLSNSTNK